LLETEAYMPPPAQEMPISTKSLNESVRNALVVAPVAGILGTGMIGVVTTLEGGTILGPLTAGVANIQLLNIQPGEVRTIPVLPITPPPIVYVPLLLPKPPPPPH